MVYCFHNNENQHEINILNDLATTEDEEAPVAAGNSCGDGPEHRRPSDR